MVSKVFARKPTYEVKIPYDVHDWIANAIADQTEQRYIPNPDKPKLLEYHNNSFRVLQDTANPAFRKGDIIWMSFKVVFTVGTDSWTLEMVLVEYVRVGRLPDALLSQGDSSAFVSLTADVAQLAIGRPVFPLQGASNVMLMKS